MSTTIEPQEIKPETVYAVHLTERVTHEQLQKLREDWQAHAPESQAVFFAGDFQIRELADNQTYILRLDRRMRAEDVEAVRRIWEERAPQSRLILLAAGMDLQELDDEALIEAGLCRLSEQPR